MVPGAAFGGPRQRGVSHRPWVAGLSDHNVAAMAGRQVRRSGLAAQKGAAIGTQLAGRSRRANCL